MFSRRRRLQSKLRKNQQTLSRLRDELAIAVEHEAHFGPLAEDARVRGLVSDAPEAAREGADAVKHARAATGAVAGLRARIAEIESAQDDLLDALSEERPD